MSSAATRILDAIQGDHTTISALASAIAKSDVQGARELLRARGVELSDGEVTEIVGAAAGDGSAACTCTCTCT